MSKATEKGHELRQEFHVYSNRDAGSKNSVRSSMFVAIETREKGNSVRVPRA
jgi:hypothetical protein